MNFNLKPSRNAQSLSSSILNFVCKNLPRVPDYFTTENGEKGLLTIDLMIDDSVCVFFDKLHAIHLKIEPLCGNDELVNKNNLDFTICINNAGHRSDPFILSTRGRTFISRLYKLKFYVFA